jgi:hypothetical protein
VSAIERLNANYTANLESIAIKRQRAYEKLFAELDVATAVEPITAGSDSGESLLHILSLYCPGAQATFGGSMKNMQIGKTIGGLDFNAELTRDGSTIRLQIAMRPSAMPQERFRDLYDVEFDFLNQPDGLSDERAEDMIKVLGSLYPVNKKNQA